MKTREEQAATMRDAFLGPDLSVAVPWGDLKQCVRDRWLAALDALRERASVPVKVRWDVTPEEFAQWHLEEFGNGNSHVTAKLKMDYLAAHAVIDATAGVPSVEELVKLLEPVWDEVVSANVVEAAATAIRDRVLAGGAALPTIQCMAENQGYSTEPPTMPTPLPSTIEALNFDQVEALARVLEAAYSSWLYMEPKSPAEPIGDAYLAEARAAIAHLSTPQPIKCIFCDFKGDSLAALKEHSAHCEKHPLYSRPEVSTKPIDLWSVITSIVDEQVDCNGCDYVEMDRTDVSDLEVALRPWLRDPVGWELDVTAGEIMHACTTNMNGYEAVIDLCRSRIRPTYECKECAKERKRGDKWADDAVKMAGMINAARAALEGE